LFNWLKRSSNKWPNDADGDALRRLEENGFNFDKPYNVDFQIEFQEWPPSKIALDCLKEHYSNIELIEPDDDFEGYVEIKIEAHLTYDFVISVQEKISEMLKDCGGKCEAWGVWQG
jgi:uncharacterized protein YciU (UPF0263 family)